MVNKSEAAKELNPREVEMVNKIVSLAQEIANECLTWTQGAKTEQERVGMIAGALVSAAQSMDGTPFARPGITAAMLDVLLGWQTRAMAQNAQRVQAGRERERMEASEAARSARERQDPVEVQRIVDGIADPDPLIIDSGILMRASDQQRLLWGVEGLPRDPHGLGLPQPSTVDLCPICGAERGHPHKPGCTA